MTIQQLKLTVVDGVELEAELALSTDRPDSGPIVVLAHPHPLRGGSMDAGIIDVLFRALPDRGISALRWNFRGVGSSTGTHDEGRAERHDVAAALDHAASATSGTVIAAGWSFGADVSAAVDHERLAGWVLIAPPLRVVPPDEMVCSTADRPSLALVAEHDQFNPPEQATPVLDSWTTTELVVIPGTDHFLAGAGTAITEAVIDFVSAATSD